MDIFEQLKDENKENVKWRKFIFQRESKDTDRIILSHSVYGGKIRCQWMGNIDGLEQQNEPTIQIAKAEIASTGEWTSLGCQKSIAWLEGSENKRKSSKNQNL